MKNTTLLFLIKKENEKITEICLAMKKRGFGMGRWNGVGGKLDYGETIEQGVIREAYEEINVHVVESDLKKVAELDFTFPHRPEFNQLVHVFTAEHWSGEPAESEEMKPQWFAGNRIPLETMWPDDYLWLPQMIDGKLIKGSFVFAEGDVVVDHKVTEVEQF